MHRIEPDASSQGAGPLSVGNKRGIGRRYNGRTCPSPHPHCAVCGVDVGSDHPDFILSMGLRFPRLICHEIAKAVRPSKGPERLFLGRVAIHVVIYYHLYLCRYPWLYHDHWAPLISDFQRCPLEGPQGQVKRFCDPYIVGTHHCDLLTPQSPEGAGQ